MIITAKDFVYEDRYVSDEYETTTFYFRTTPEVYAHLVRLAPVMPVSEAFINEMLAEPDQAFATLSIEVSDPYSYVNTPCTIALTTKEGSSLSDVGHVDIELDTSLVDTLVAQGLRIKKHDEWSKDYQQETLTQFFFECVRFWEHELKTDSDLDKEPYINAIQEIPKFDPYVPYTPKPIDEDVRKEFVKSRCMDCWGKDWETHFEKYYSNNDKEL